MTQCAHYVLVTVSLLQQLGHFLTLRLPRWAKSQEALDTGRVKHFLAQVMVASLLTSLGLNHMDMGGLSAARRFHSLCGKCPTTLTLDMSSYMDGIAIL